MSTVKSTFAFLALVFVLLGLTPTLDLRTASEIKEAIVKPLTVKAWNTQPRKTVFEVDDAQGVWSWLHLVFLPNLYDHSDQTGGRIMLARYNRPLYARISLKRVRFVPMETSSFMNALENKWKAGVIHAGSRNDGEDTRNFGQTETFTYSEDHGFNLAGGFVEYFDLSNETATLSRINTLYDNYWFDLHQGSFALELLTYNGNVDLFEYIYFTFDHTFVGQSIVTVSARPLDMSLNDSRSSEFWTLIFLYICYFVIILFISHKEFRLLTSSPMEYIKNGARVYTMGMLVVYCIAAVMYAKVILSHAYFNFTFLEGGDLITDDLFDNLIGLARQMDDVVWWLSVTICMTVVKSLCLLSNLTEKSSLLANVVESVIWQLMTYVGMVFVLIMGFSVAGYVLFGTKLREWGEFQKAFGSCMRMIMKTKNYDDMIEGDDSVGHILFVFFHLVFLILDQFLLSILLTYYLKERADQKENEFQNEFKKVIFSAIEFLKREISAVDMFISKMQQKVAGGSGVDAGGAASNYDEVAERQEKRATWMPRRRVVYDKKKQQGDDADEDPEYCKINSILKLHAEYPKYKGGFMHYYIDKPDDDDTEHDFKAEEAANHLDRNHVQPEYRLLAVHTEDRGWDRFDFRKRKVYENVYQRDMKNLLNSVAERYRQEGQVILEFEGWIQPISKECVALLTMIVFFLVFSVTIARVSDSNSLSFIREQDFVRDPRWTAEFPGADGGYEEYHWEDVVRFEQVGSWAVAAMEQEYRCLEAFGHSESCEDALLQDDILPKTLMVRSGWGLWLNGRITPLESTYGYIPEVNGTLPYYNWTEDSMPRALNGLSLGYVPYLPPAAGVNEVQFSNALKRHYYNVGVMPHNHMRITFQVACFQENVNNKVNAAYPYVLAREYVEPVSCSDEDCMRKFIESTAWLEDQECFTITGQRISPTHLQGEGSGVHYNYNNAAGTYRALGGITVGFGNTAMEAFSVINMLASDNIFEHNVVSFCLETALYNEPSDLFVYTSVTWNQKATGYVVGQVVSNAVPLGWFTVGAGTDAGLFVAIWFGFIIYVILTIAFTVHFFICLQLQFQITRLLGKDRNMFLWHFISEDPWNMIDICTTATNLAVTINLFLYLFMISGDYWNDNFGLWRAFYYFQSTATMSERDPFDPLEKTSRLWQSFLYSCGLNSFFLFIRFLKYLYGFEPLRLMLRSLAASAFETTILMAGFLLLLYNFALTFWLRYGSESLLWGTMDRAYTHLVMFFCGYFDKGMALKRRDQMFFTNNLVVLFFLTKIVLGLLFSATAYAWTEIRKDAQTLSTQRSLSIATDTIKGFLDIGPMKKVGVKLANKFQQCALKALKHEDKVQTQKLPKEFWKDRSALESMKNLDKRGKITKKDAEGKVLNAPEEEAAAEDSDASSDVEDEDNLSDDGADARATEAAARREAKAMARLQKKLTKNFKRAYVRMAKELCDEEGRRADERREKERFEERQQASRKRIDTGGGVGPLIEETAESADPEKAEKASADAEADEDDEADDFLDNREVDLGMINESQPTDTSKAIEGILNNTLDVMFFRVGDRVQVHPSVSSKPNYHAVRSKPGRPCIGIVSQVDRELVPNEAAPEKTCLKFNLTVNFETSENPVYGDSTDFKLWYRGSSVLDDIKNDNKLDLTDPVLSALDIPPEEQQRKSILDDNAFVQEVWFDALITACEQAQVIEKARAFLGAEEVDRVAGAKLKEWKQAKSKRDRLQQRLDLFLRLLEQEAELKHLSFLRIGTDAKEKKVKLQTMALIDYCNKLNERIEMLQGETKDIDKKVGQYESMRALCGINDISRQQQEYEDVVMNPGIGEE